MKSTQTLHIPIEQVDPSPLNYRKTHKRIDELATSIRASGQQQPVKVRPVGERYELVYGERRYRAILKIGLPTIRADVEVLDDKQVREIQAVENSQREDPDPLEEAEGWEKLLDQPGKPHTPESIAALVGRSPQYVYQRLKLCSLVEPARAALRDEAINVSTAFYIARLPGPNQLEVLGQLAAYRDQGDELTAAEVAQLIEDQHMLRLVNAPFPTADAELLPKAGSCKTCLKRSGNQPELFGDLKTKDTCTDNLCFRAKIDALWERSLAAVKATGDDVMSPEVSAKLFGHSTQLPYGGDWLDLDTENFADEKHRTWRKLLAKKIPAVTLSRDGRGAPRELVRRNDVVTILGSKVTSKAGGKGTATGSGDGLVEDLKDQRRAEEAKRKKRSVISRDAVRLAVAKIVEKAEKHEADETFWRVWFEACLRGSWHDTIAEVCRRRDIPLEKSERPEDALRRATKTMKGAQLRALGLELAVSRCAVIGYDGSIGEGFKLDCDALRVNLDKCKDEAKANYENKLAARDERKAKKASGKKSDGQRAA